jgi:hypothetical protein
MFHGKGGYTYDTVYNMPIWLRNFTFNKINDFYIKQSEEYEKASSNKQKVELPKVKVPDFVSKARK